MSEMCLKDLQSTRGWVNKGRPSFVNQSIICPVVCFSVFCVLCFGPSGRPLFPCFCVLGHGPSLVFPCFCVLDQALSHAAVFPCFGPGPLSDSHGRPGVSAFKPPGCPMLPAQWSREFRKTSETR